MLNIKQEDIAELIPISQADESVIIKIKLVNKITLCPYCNSKLKNHGYYQRKLLHSTLVNRKCVIVYQQRRYRCDECDFTFHEPNPFSSSKENITYETKLNVLKDLKWPESTYTNVARRYHLSKTQVIRIFEKHVKISRKPLPAILSMDEHYFPESSYDSLYCCVLMDFESGEIIDILPDRKKSFLLHYFSKIKHETLNYSTNTSELSNVKYISIDLFDNYREIAKTYFPNAKVCADSFHVLKHLTESFRNVRLRCRRSTEDPVLFYLLNKFKFVFHHNVNLDNTPKYNKKLGKYANYRDIRDYLFIKFPELDPAYQLKEKYINFNEKTNNADVVEDLEHLIRLFGDCNIPEYDQFYNLLKNWRDEIINSFTVINCKRINNSFIESKNRQLGKLINNANGFTNFTRTRNRILYCLNKNETYTL